MPLGRYPNADAPNKGNLTIRAHTEKYQIFSLEHLPTTIDWKGAEVVMRPVAWIIDRAVVDAQYGDALNLFNYSNYTPRDNSEYFFQNHPATLDQENEWCYEQSSKKISLYSTKNVSTNAIYTATVYNRGIDIANVSYVTLRNIKIVETLNTGINGQNVSNLTMSAIDVLSSGEDGIVILGSGNTIILEKSNIVDVNNNGIWIDPYQTVTIKESNIRRVGVIPGRGKSGDGQYNGVSLMANQNVLIDNNVIDSVGYNGITFLKNTTIQRNVISNYCFSKIDGGGVYSWNGNKESRSNIHIVSNIFYTKPAGNVPWVDYAIGIFLDDCVENVDIRGNTIFGNTQWGVFLHAANNVTFTDNTLFDNTSSQLVVYHNNGACPIRGDVIKRNIIVSKTASQLVAQYESNADDLQLYGTIDSNYYARPFNEEATVRGVINSGQGGNYELKDWQNFSKGHDLHTKDSPIRYVHYKNEGSGGLNRVNSTFDNDPNGWQLVYSPYGNAEAAFDNTNKLDGGSLRIGFPTPSGQSNSYAQAVKPFGSITKDRTYVLRFDAISTSNVPILVYLRQYGAPYREFDRRYSVVIEPTRKSYELVFTASDNEANAIVMFQTDTEGPTFWIDNVRMQEGVSIQNNPDDFIKLYYNPTLKDSTVSLPAGAYRDVKNQSYSGSVLLKPFTSIILLKDTIPVPPADLSIALQSNKRLLQIGEDAIIQLKVKNEGDTQASLAKWTYRLPANMQFVTENGQVFSDNVLTGTVSQLAPSADTTFLILVRATAAGLFRTTAQLTTATSYDPDSQPNSGTGDGEDDASLLELRVGATSDVVFESPNPNQRVLPAVVSNQPAVDPTKADLSLHMAFSKRTAGVGEVVSCTISITNAGGATASGIQIQNQLPANFDLVESAVWTVNDRSMVTNSLPSIPAGATYSVAFQFRAMQSGNWVNQAQISASGISDPDSTPGNGFTTGEDDQAQADIRIR